MSKRKAQIAQHLEQAKKQRGDKNVQLSDESSDDNEPEEEIKTKKQLKAQARDLGRYINKQRTLVFGTRGISHRDRHLMEDLRDMLPHSKKDVKFDAKAKLHEVNEVCEMKNCNNAIFLEARKKKDLYMWIARAPHGPSAKFLVQNIHTMSEVKLTGNAMKGSRPMLVFDPKFDTEPHYHLMKEMFIQVFGSPKGHPKVKPFIDHVLSFFIADDRIWFRNYQIAHESVEGTKSSEPVLVEIGPRFVLNPVRVFQGSFSGQTIWENSKYQSPNQIRAMIKAQVSARYGARVSAKANRKAYLKDEGAMPENPLASDSVFAGGLE